MRTRFADWVARAPSGLYSRLLVGLLVVLTSVALLLSGVAIWVHHTVLDTDGYVAVVESVSSNPATLEALSEYVAGQVVEVTDLEARTSELLPQRLTFLAPPLTAAVRDFVSTQTYALVSTPKAQELWIAGNRVAHAQVVALLRGDTTLARIEGDAVVINTLPLISQALVRIDAALPGTLSTHLFPPVITADMSPEEAIQKLSAWLGRSLPSDAGQITLLTSSALGPAQTAVKWLDRLVIVLPIVTVLLAAAAIYLSRDRRRTVIELAIGVVAALVIFHVVVARVTDVLLERLRSEQVGGVARDIVAASFGPLTTMTIWIVVVGVIVAAGAWVLGRQDVLRAAHGALSAGGSQVRRASGVLTWSAAHVDLLRIAGLGVGLLLLALFSWSWLWVVLWLALVALVQLAISAFAGAWPFAGRRT
ncbi:MAG: hypothetical protein R2826_04805 [Thermoleophilia bacterium]